MRQAEVIAAKRMIERAHDRLDLWPERLKRRTRAPHRSPERHGAMPPHELLAPAVEERIGADDEPAGV
jgi:hypothetical protein